jgi:Arc/MetJ-type ribon-helix-helix transcriptional regulator
MGKEESEEELLVITVKVTKSLHEMIKRFLRLDAHVTLSDFVRDAIREKIKRDAPWLYEEMLRKGEESR